jgi:hypothetical protein
VLTLNNITALYCHYNNTLNQITKADSNTTQYYIYDYQGNRVRSVVESNNQIQSQRDYLPLLDLSINGVKVAGGLLSFGATVVVWVDGEGLLPITTVCLM